MAVYKVLQDIEADDKLLGPLSLKQFVFAVITVGLIFIQFRIVTASALGLFRWPMIAIFLPPTVLFGVLASPLGGDQPTEIWLLARLRFYLKPRRRTWNQDGPKELVTITVPKKIERKLTKGFNENEVHSRLDALANVMDSRGWAVKNVNVNLTSTPAYNAAEDDRLVAADTIPQEVSPVDVQPSDDIMDTANSYVAQNFENMIQRAEDKHREQLREQIDLARTRKTSAQAPQDDSVAAADTWFSNQQAVTPTNIAATAPMPVYQAPPAPVAPPAVQRPVAPTAQEEQSLLQKVHEQKQREQAGGSFAHMKTIRPGGQNPPAAQAQAATPTPTAPATPPAPDPDIINLARDNDKTVATIARQANKVQQSRDNDGEIVIKLR